MKPVTGSVGSSKPVSLPKAASILSSFASSQAGARQHAAAFLRLASASFDELVAFHGGFRPRRETPSSRDKEEARRRKKKSEEAASLGQKEGIFAEIEGNPGQSEPFPCGDPVGILGIGKSGRGEKRRKKKSEEAAFLVEKDGIFAGIEGNPGQNERFLSGEPVGILDIKDGKSDRREKKKKQPREEAAFLVDKDGSFAEVERKPGQNERLLRREAMGILGIELGKIRTREKKKKRAYKEGEG